MLFRGKDRVVGGVVASSRKPRRDDREDDDTRDAIHESKPREPRRANNVSRGASPSPPFSLACCSKAHRPVLPSKSRAMMLSMFNLSVSAIGPESSARPEPHTEHLITRMIIDPPGFLRLRVARHSGARSRFQRTRYLAMAARITAHSTPFRLFLFPPLPFPSLPFPSASFLPLSQPRRELVRPLLD